jgi:hypothetical protein
VVVRAWHELSVREGMMKRVPIQAAKDVAKKYGMVSAVLVLIESDGREHVVTWGSKYLGWPSEMCLAKPARQIRKEKDGEK